MNEFGARTHEYRLADPISESELTEIEERNGFAFPPCLRDFWCNAGAGGAGPYYGVLGPLKVEHLRQADPLTPVAELHRRALMREVLLRDPELRRIENEHGELTGDSRFEELVDRALAGGIEIPTPVLSGRHFEGSANDITGLIAVIEYGCGHTIAVATQVPVGRMFEVSDGWGVVETEFSFKSLYDGWLNGLIDSFVKLMEVTAGGVNVEGLRSLDSFGMWQAVRRLASVRGIVLPELQNSNAISGWCARGFDGLAAPGPIELPRLPL